LIPLGFPDRQKDLPPWPGFSGHQNWQNPEKLNKFSAGAPKTSDAAGRCHDTKK
jgi:hypothetical protein